MEARLPESVGRKNQSAKKTLRYALVVVIAVVAFFWRQRRSPFPLPFFLRS